MATTATDISGPAGVLLAVIDRPLWLRLFVNDRLPTPTDTVEDYQEASFPGYRPVWLMPDRWAVRLTVPPTAVTKEKQTFWRTEEEGEPEAVYGYFLTGTDGALRAPAARFVGGPETMEFQNDRLLIEPTLEGAQIA